MGACRYLNLLLGLSLGDINPPVQLIPLITGIHIFGVTRLSRRETEGDDRLGIGISGLATLCVLIIYGMLHIAGVLPEGLGFWLCIAWGAGLAILLVRLMGSPTPGRTQQTIKYSLMALVVLDGIIVAGHGPAALSIVVWMMLVPTIVVARKFYVT
jgi:phosphatidylserine synthase